MRKLLYMAAVNENSKSVGVWNKIKMQINYLKSQNIQVDFCYVNQKNNLLSKIRTRVPYTGFYSWIVDRDKVNNTDCVYIRYAGCDYQLIESLKTMKKINSSLKILVEIPTYPYDQELKLTFSNAVWILKDRLNRRKLHKYVDYIITYSNDKCIFNIPTMQLSNAVNSSVISAKNIALSDSSIHVIAVARFEFWHGYDRFLKGLYKYYKSAEDNKVNIQLHFVGESTELETYKSLVDDYHLRDHVFFCGTKVGKEIDEVYDQCEIGLDAMGRHRSGVYYNSTIKGKEYGAKGLPIVSGVKTELDADHEYRYYMRVPADESPINIQAVINFYHQIYNTDESKKTIISNIRDYTRRKFDISIAGKDVVNYIKQS